MNTIIEILDYWYKPEPRQPGVTLSELADGARKHGIFTPFVPLQVTPLISNQSIVTRRFNPTGP